MHIRSYETPFESRSESRFAMLAKQLDEAVKEFPGLKPRLLHLADLQFNGSWYLVAIVVWE